MEKKNLNCKIFASNECVTTYLREIRKYKTMTAEEEGQAFIRLQEGDTRAREEIILANQRFIFSLAKKYAKDEKELLDYVNEGNIGLMEAIESFDITRGLKFITHSVAYIRRSMHYYMNRFNKSVTNSMNVTLMPKVNAIRKDFFDLNGYYPSKEIILEELKERYNIEVLDSSYLYNITVSSISEGVDDDDEATKEDIGEYNERTATDPEREENDLHEENINAVDEVVGGLQDEIIAEFKTNGVAIPKGFPNFGEIFKMYYGIGYGTSFSLNELSEEYGIPEDIIKTWIKNCEIIVKRHEAKFRLRTYKVADLSH